MTARFSLAPYDPLWVAEFDAERGRIEHAFGELPHRIDHIGSTAVPDLAARPVIDTLVGVPAGVSREAYVAALRQLGYEPIGAAGAPGRDVFRRGRPVSHTVHLVAWSSDEWRDAIAFRDYLREHPAAAAEYATVKRELARARAQQRDDELPKGPFIQAILRRAAAEQADGEAA